MDKNGAGSPLGGSFSPTSWDDKTESHSREGGRRTSPNPTARPQHQLWGLPRPTPHQTPEGRCLPTGASCRLLTVPLGKDEMSRSCRKGSPNCIHQPSSIVPVASALSDCWGGTEGARRVAVLTGTSPSPSGAGARVSARQALPSSSEGTTFSERAQRQPQTSPLRCLNPCGAWGGVATRLGNSGWAERD